MRLASLVRLMGRPLATSAAPVRAADAIVVLGSPLLADTSLNRAAEERVVVGAALWRRGLAPILCMSGGRNRVAVVDLPEAMAMARRARELGVPAEALCVETTSRNTSENASRTAALLMPAGRRRVIVVTQPFHQRRALLWFRRVGFDAVGWHIADSLQFRDVRLGLRWVTHEYVALARDLLVTRRPSG